ncbi:hypothetical protein [Kozakia baliensis]|uniref:hypothetical protein n=1 Tax=Kozakia baliensis TaxID=153496 RepID=UPI00191C6804|nr:hypothetical protein [Kozakia baliensis]
MRYPEQWTTIAVYSDNENRFSPAPGAQFTVNQATNDPGLHVRTTKISGKKILQIKAK